MRNWIIRSLTNSTEIPQRSKQQDNCKLCLKNCQFHFTIGKITDTGLADEHFKVLSS